MSVKPIREHAGKSLLQKLLPEVSGGKHKMGEAGVLVTPAVLDSTSGQSWDSIVEQNPWLKTTNLVAKPDQLIKRRGKAGLIAVNKTFEEAKQWVMDRMCKEQKVEHVTGQLTHFLIEPFVPHKQEQEHYICMLSHRSSPFRASGRLSVISTCCFRHRFAIHLHSFVSIINGIQLKMPIALPFILFFYII